MTRVKRGTTKNKRRKNVLAQTKGFRFGRKNKEALAKEAIVHAGSYAFAHRKDKKADRRTLWNVKLNAAVRPHGLSYSKFIDALKKKNIALDRKVLAYFAEHEPAVFEKIVKAVA